MKRIIALLVALMMVFTFSACGTQHNISNVEGEVGDYYIKITGYELTEDYEGNNAIVIYYDFTNNSSKTISPMQSIIFYLFQDGEKLDSTLMGTSIEDNHVDLGSATPVASGETISASSVHVLSDTDTKIECEIYDIVSFGDNVFKFEINLGE